MVRRPRRAPEGSRARVDDPVFRPRRFPTGPVSFCAPSSAFLWRRRCDPSFPETPRPSGGGCCLPAAFVLLTACDAGGADSPQACRDHVSTLAVTRAAYRLNVLRGAALRVETGEREIVTKVGRFSGDDVGDALARAGEDLRVAQEDLDAKLRACEGRAR